MREVYGDVGKDRGGRVVQVISDSLGFLSFSEEQLTQERFWVYDFRTGRPRRLELTAPAPGCVIERVAVWLRRTALGANCAGDGAIFLTDGTSVRRVLDLPRLDRFAFTRVELDATDAGIGVSVAYKRCSRPPTPGEQCSFTTGPPERNDAWLLRDGCEPRLMARTTLSSQGVDAPQIQGGTVYWLEGRAGVAKLRSRQLRPGCGVGPSRVALRIGPWQQHVSAAVAGRAVFVARDDHGIEQFTRPER